MAQAVQMPTEGYGPNSYHENPVSIRAALLRELERHPNETMPIGDLLQPGFLVPTHYYAVHSLANMQIPHGVVQYANGKVTFFPHDGTPMTPPYQGPRLPKPESAIIEAFYDALRPKTAKEPPDVAINVQDKPLRRMTDVYRECPVMKRYLGARPAYHSQFIAARNAYDRDRLEKFYLGFSDMMEANLPDNDLGGRMTDVLNAISHGHASTVVDFLNSPNADLRISLDQLLAGIGYMGARSYSPTDNLIGYVEMPSTSGPSPSGRHLGVGARRHR
ncbi:MAG TPA: hypothetical protein VI979_01340 [archaeon]|nr:hypothetical protein [archaeon]